MNRRNMLQLGALASTGIFLSSNNFPSLSSTSFNYPVQALNRIRLNANENVYGPSKAAQEAITKAITQANRYPLVNALPQLKTTLAEYHGVDESMILITAGSLQALRIIGTKLSKGTGNHVAPDLSFTVLMRQAELMGCKWKKAPVNKDKSINLQAMKKAIDTGTQFVYVTNPNNPTGHFIEKDRVASFCTEVSRERPVIVDEAYIEFVDKNEKASLIDMVKTNSNLIFVRTFSKIYGLAGLRIGYAIAKPEWIEEWSQWDQNAQIGIANVSAMAALASLNDQRFADESREKIADSRNQFVNGLDQLGIKSYPSLTNFIICETGSFEKKLIPILEKERIDIAIGRSDAMTGLARISIGTPQQMNLLLNHIKSVL